MALYVEGFARHKASSPETLKTADSFLRNVLRHYVVDSATVYGKELLQCRARLFHRAGKLLQGWPGTDIATQAALAKIEAKYASELLAAMAFAEPPARLFAEPTLAKTAGTAQAQAHMNWKKRSRPTTEPEVLAEDALAADPVEESPLPALAYELPSDDMARLDPAPWTSMAGVMWQRLVSHGFVHVCLKHKLSSLSVEVHVLEASDPVVYQARALAKVAVGELVLVPFVSAEMTPFVEGTKWKRPRTLHPHLPFAVVCSGAAPTYEEYHHFLAKSPLASASSVPASAPAPFWAALQAQSPEHANLKIVNVVMTIPSTAVHLEQEVAAAKKAKKAKAEKAMPLEVRVPALVNTRPIERGEVLIFDGESDLIGLTKELDDSRASAASAGPTAATEKKVGADSRASAAAPAGATAGTEKKTGAAEKKVGSRKKATAAAAAAAEEDAEEEATAAEEEAAAAKEQDEEEGLSAEERAALRVAEATLKAAEAAAKKAAAAVNKAT